MCPSVSPCVHLCPSVRPIITTIIGTSPVWPKAFFVKQWQPHSCPMAESDIHGIMYYNVWSGERMSMVRDVVHITLHDEFFETPRHAEGVGGRVTFNGFTHGSFSWSFHLESELQPCTRGVYHIFFGLSALKPPKEYYFKQIASTRNYELCLKKGTHCHNEPSTVIRMLL